MQSIWNLLIEATIDIGLAIASPMPRLIESALPLLNYAPLKLASSCLATAARSVKLS